MSCIASSTHESDSSFMHPLDVHNLSNKVVGAIRAIIENPNPLSLGRKLKLFFLWNGTLNGSYK